MPNMVTSTHSLIGVRRRASTPRLASFASPRGPAEVPPRTYQTRVVLGAAPAGNFDPTLVDQANPQPILPDGAGVVGPAPQFRIIPRPPVSDIPAINPATNCPWDAPPGSLCDQAAPFTPDSGTVLSPAGSTPVPQFRIVRGVRMIGTGAQPSVPTAPAPVNPPAPTLITSGTPQTSAPVSTAPATALVATSPAATAAAVSLTPTQIKAGAVGFNSAGQAIDATGNVIGFFAEFSAWMGEQTVINGIPNWVFAAGGAAVLAFMFMGKGKR